MGTSKTCQVPCEQVARPRGNRRVSEDDYRLTEYLGAPRLEAWVIIIVVVLLVIIIIIIIVVGHVAVGGSIELPINLEGSATRAGDEVRVQTAVTASRGRQRGDVQIREFCITTARRAI